MSGTPEGAAKAKETKLKKYGENHFSVIASLGGKANHTGGFASPNKGRDGLTGPERARKVRLGIRQRNLNP